MKFKQTSIKLKKGDVVTSLYHSPFDYNLLYLICLAKTGLKVRIILDDIDNIGIDRMSSVQGYSYSEKFFLSKTERTNLRPLTLTIPKHLLANLAFPSLKELDSKVGINKIKNELGYLDTVEHWIKDTTRQLGVYSLVGPDKSFAFSKVDSTFIEALNCAKLHLTKILLNFKLENKDALIFVDWLFSDSAVIGETISSYYLRIINKIIDKFKLSEVVTVECMSGELLQKNNDELLRKFKENTDLQELYIEALNMDGKKDTTDFPFYSVSKKDGERLLSIDRYLNNPNEYIVAPKVLMLNNFENLVLPYHAIEKNNVYAREIMYSNSNINCNQVFCDDKWFDHIVSFNTDINLDPVERELYDKLDISIQKLKQFEVTSNSVQDEYKNWIIGSTNIAFDQAKYPLIFLALFQEDLFYKDIPDFYKLTIDEQI